MTATEIQRRVDAWLAARDAWASETKRRRFLVGQWRHVCPVFGADSDAALGVLRGIVQEAHSDVRISVRWVDDMGLWACELDAQNGWRRWAGSVAEALLMALEAAP